MATDTLPGLHVVQVRYRDDERSRPESDPIAAYAASGAYDMLGAATVVEPEFPEERRDAEPTINLGLIGGEIAAEVAEGRREGKPVVVVGGTCAVVPGVVGGLQEAHGPAARIGLVWFDAHGDFNTPRTTLSGMLGGMPVAVSAGLACPRWRSLSRQAAPLPAHTERGWGEGSSPHDTTLASHCSMTKVRGQAPRASARIACVDG